jgi:hypothetical protein
MPLSRKLAGLAGWLLTAALVTAATTIGACNRGGVDLDKVTPGTEVTLTRQDGGVVKGPVERVEPNTVVVKVGERSKTVPRTEISTVQIDEPGVPAKALPPAAKYREFVVPTGTTLSLKLMTAAGSETSRVEDAVSAELTEGVVIDGVEVLPAGTPVSGTVLSADDSDKVKGRASLALRFHSIRAGGETYPVAMTYSRTAEGTKASDAKKIGIPAAGGAVIGGILGGKKGAVIGGVIGGGAGTAAVLTTSGKEVVLPVGTVLKLSLDRDVEVRVSIKGESE